MNESLKTQVSGDHYTKLKIQPMEYSMANGLDACQHSVIKYVTRFRDKAGITDLQKAKHCIDMLIDFERTRLADLAKDFVADEAPKAFLPHGATHRWTCGDAFSKECPQKTWAIWQDGEWLWIGDEFKGEMISLDEEFPEYPNPTGEPYTENVIKNAPKADPFGPRDADGWYTWNGDDTMRPAGRVEVMLRSGGTAVGAGESATWTHLNSGGDIVKWRPAQ